MTHTPTPWEFAPGYDNTDGDRALGGIVGADGTHIARIWSDQEHAEVDAQFIVTACNAHEELVAALRCAASALDTLIKDNAYSSALDLPAIDTAIYAVALRQARQVLHTIEKGG